MIILNSKECKNNFKEMLIKYQKSLNYGYLECPHCDSSHLIRWGFYHRNIYYIDSNKILFEVLNIQRVKCKQCGHTHALLPEGIIPFRQFSLNVILNCVYETDLSYNYNFSYDTIYKWKYQFNKFVPYLKTMFYNQSQYLFNYLINNIFSVYKKFYDINKKILMMTHLGIYNMAYF
jgi:hypothetical protein